MFSMLTITTSDDAHFGIFTVPSEIFTWRFSDYVEWWIKLIIFSRQAIPNKNTAKKNESQFLKFFKKDFTK